MIINAGIEELIIKEGYPDKMAENILKEGKIKVRYLNKKTD
jgi:deoxycytidylate deaminase